MPYKCENIRLSETQDRRRKLTEKDRQEIIAMYATGDWSLNKLAKLYDVSKSTILLTVNPDSMERMKQYRKKNWRQWQRTGEEWNAVQRRHRQYKHELYQKGELTDEKTYDAS